MTEVAKLINGKYAKQSNFFKQVTVEEEEPIAQDYALIGRDIPNKLKIILDAPNLPWSLEKSEKS